MSNTTEEARRLSEIVYECLRYGSAAGIRRVQAAREAVRALNALASKQADGGTAFVNMQRQMDDTEKIADLRRALEIIAVGDAKNPQLQAAEELIAMGYWRDIPEARTHPRMAVQRGWWV